MLPNTKQSRLKLDIIHPEIGSERIFRGRSHRCWGSHMYEVMGYIRSMLFSVALPLCKCVCGFRRIRFSLIPNRHTALSKIPLHVKFFLYIYTKCFDLVNTHQTLGWKNDGHNKEIHPVCQKKENTAPVCLRWTFSLCLFVIFHGRFQTPEIQVTLVH